MKHLIEFGVPPDGVAWSALIAAAILGAILALRPRARTRPGGVARPIGWVVGLCILASVLSAGYVTHYLRGGPRIIDATSYWLEARAIAHGLLSFEVPGPLASFQGRFLVTAEGTRRMAVIFPPGYPAVLALGFVVGKPLLVGPAIAAALVAATYSLARRVFHRVDVALVAAVLSVACAALRYHTADTMSHGWAALLLTLSLFSALGPSSTGSIVAGLACGGLLATRPVTGMVALGLSVWLILSRASTRQLVLFAVGIVPGVSLLFLHQYAATGSPFASSQLSYYALADGPPGCFRYGFGPEIGCRHEHGDFVRAQLAQGYGPLEALKTTGRRLVSHLEDIANFEPFALLVPAAAVVAWRTGRRGGRALVIGTVGVIVGYVPFYFDGNYPGGGARLFADILPLEHILLASVLARWQKGGVAVVVALIAFAVHTSFGHRRLAEREGGRPMWEPRVLERAGVRRGLVFVDTDHGFNLGFDPSKVDASSAIVVARRRADSNDGLLWESLGRPAAFDYLYDPSQPSARPRVVRHIPELGDTLVFEAETQGWPAIFVDGGWLHPDFHPAASRGRALRLHATAGQSLRTAAEITVPATGCYQLVTDWVLTGASVNAELWVSDAYTQRVLTGQPDGIVRWPGPTLGLPEGPRRVSLAVRGREALLDRWMLLPRPPSLACTAQPLKKR